MKKSETVLVFRPVDGPPVVCADDREARDCGMTGQGELVTLDVAMALSVNHHHDWREKARSNARMRVADLTGKVRSNFVLDPAEPDTKKIPKSVRTPPEFGGVLADVICSHEGQCVCGARHATTWLDVKGRLMVTVCAETKKVYWVERVDPLGGGDA